MAAITIRDAQLTDVDVITPQIAQLGYPSSADQVRQRLQRLLGIHNVRVLVADLEGIVVGVAVTEISHRIEHDQPVSSLRAIVTDEQHRGHGIGARLIRAVEAEARMHECCAIVLNSGNQRHGAHAFYRRMGYAGTGTRFVRWLSDR